MSRTHVSSSPSRQASPWTYRAPTGPWDEFLTPEGHPREHWRRLAAGLRRMGYGEFTRRVDLAERLIQTNGITYNVYGDPRGQQRPWLMDQVPLVLDEQEWAGIERAVIQRATLLNAILADIYGSQILLRDRLLPPELVFGNARFLRPCHGLRPKADVYLQHYAVDIARAPNGSWWVLTDRTQAPSGLGYALENRLVSARTLPTLLTQCHVRPLSRFFDQTFDALLALSPNRAPSPRVVVLTSGPFNETYFEHSYLAKYWGATLVGGDDLTVRDGRVYLKTVAGLNQVDVIVRRMDDDFCDPLELRGDSLLGVPGLLQAVRLGTVFIANALGSGLVETPALMAFLPGLCQQVLGEPLRLPSVATWWCGQAEPRREVLDRLTHLVIKPTFQRHGLHPEFPATMTAAERTTLAERIEAHPNDYVAQEQVALSTVPVHTHRGLEPRHVVLRLLAAWDGSSYAVMPGGLTRVATGDRSLVVSMQMGGGSKDTWVVQPRLARTERDAPLLPRPAQVADAQTELSSRVADNLYWLGRYIERLDATARLIRLFLPDLSDGAAFGRTISAETIVHYLRGLRLVPEEFRHAVIARQWWRLQNAVSQLVFEDTRSTGVGWNLQQIRRLSWEVKERLSQDTWRVLQQLERATAQEPPAQPDRRVVTALGRLDDIVMLLAAVAGLLAEHPTRGHGWRFLDIGRRTERALQMLELLQVGVATAPYPDDAYLEVLLQVADNSTTYRSRYLTAIRTRHVLELLLLDETNPRSVAYQLVTLMDRLRALPSEGVNDDAPREDIVLVSRLLDTAKAPSVDTLKRRDATGRRLALEAHLQTLRNGVVDVTDALTTRYLSHSMPSRLTATS